MDRFIRFVRHGSGEGGLAMPNSPEMVPNKMYHYLRVQLSPSPFSERKTEREGASFEQTLVKTMTASGASPTLYGLEESVRMVNMFRSSVDRYEPAHSPLYQEVVSTDRTAFKSLKRRSSVTPSAYDDIIRAASQRFGVREELIRAVIFTESSFRPDAVSPAGAKGLMQLMDRTAASLGVTDPFDPVQNIMGGTRYLAQMLQRFNGSEKLALAAYNAGPGRLKQLGIHTEEDLMKYYHRLPLETQRYIPKVLGQIG